MIYRGISAAWAQDAWKSVSHSQKNKLFRVHSFLFIAGGHSFSIEVQESASGDFLAHAENMSDPHDVLPSVHGKGIEDCVRQLVQHIEAKS